MMLVRLSTKMYWYHLSCQRGTYMSYSERLDHALSEVCRS